MYGAEGEFSDGGFAAEHDGVGAVEDGVGDVADLGAGGACLLDHGLEHLSGDDDGFSGRLTAADKLFLDDGDLGDVHFDAEVAAGDHEAVGGVENVVDLIERLGFFDLGDEVNVGGFVLEMLAEKKDVLGVAYEREGEVIEIVFDGPVDAFPIAIGDGGDVDAAVGKVDALGGFEDAADGAVAAQLAEIFLSANKSEQAVFDEEAVADLDVVDEVGVDAADAAVFAEDGCALDDELVADGDGHSVAAVVGGDLTETDFGAAEVAEDCDGLAPAHGGFADVAEHLEVGIEIAVGEIESADIDAGLEKGIEGFDIAAGGTHSGDNFGTDHFVNSRVVLGSRSYAWARGPLRG